MAFLAGESSLLQFRDLACYVLGGHVTQWSTDSILNKNGRFLCDGTSHAVAPCELLQCLAGDRMSSSMARIGELDSQLHPCLLCFCRIVQAPTRIRLVWIERLWFPPCQSMLLQGHDIVLLLLCSVFYFLESDLEVIAEHLNGFLTAKQWSIILVDFIFGSPFIRRIEKCTFLLDCSHSSYFKAIITCIDVWCEKDVKTIKI